MRLQIMLDRDRNAAFAQKGFCIRAGSLLIRSAPVQQLILRQPRHLRIVLAAQARILQQMRHDRFVRNLQAGHKMLCLRAVHRIIVDEQHALRPQLYRLDQPGQPRPLRIPGNA
jgi:hypothetical protein